MITRIVNKEGKTVGLIKEVSYNGARIKQGYECRTVLTQWERRNMIQKINARIERSKEEVDKELRRKRHKESLKKFLDKMSDREYLDFEQMKKAISLNPNLTYMYGLISGLSDFKVTQKGIKGIDSVGNTVYLYPKDKTYFYKDSFLGMY